MRKWFIFIFVFLFSQIIWAGGLQVKIDFQPHYKAEGLFKDKIYTVFIVEFHNTGKKAVKVGETFTLTTDTGKKYLPHPAPWIRKDIRDKLGIKEKFVWIGNLKPGDTQTKIVVFQKIDPSAKIAYLNIFGLYPGYILQVEFKRSQGTWRETGRKWVKK